MGPKTWRALNRERSAFTRPKRRKPGGGRKHVLTPEDIARGIDILRRQPRMKVWVACNALKQAGFKGMDTILYGHIVRPAYRSHYIEVPTARLRRFIRE